MKKKKEKQQKKVENKLVDIMNNDSMKLFSMLSLYFLSIFCWHVPYFLANCSLVCGVSPSKPSVLHTTS